MAGNDGSTGRFGSWVSNGQLLITLLTAAFSLYLSVQQGKIKEKQDDLSFRQQEIKTEQEKLVLAISTKAETEKFVQQTLSYVETKLSIPVAKQKEAIIIDLLDAIALANVSQQGTTDRQKILHTPLWIALATGNVEALGLIGNADNRRDVWFDLATGSGDVTVRKTAMEALARSSASKPLEHLLKIYQLSEDLNNSDILDSAIEQIGRVVQVMERYPDPARFREDDQIKPLISRLEALRTSLAASVAAPGGDEKTTTERRATLQRQAQGVERALAFLRGSEVAAVATAQPASETTPDTTPEPSIPKVNVESLIKGLKSTDTDTRRQSRQTLANINDPKAIDQLLDELTKEKSYRVRLGVASALYQTKQPVVIANQAHMRALVELIGDDDVLIRKYASESLMKLTDPETVNLVYSELTRIIDNRASESPNAVSPNAVYNAVVVLGTWLRILPSNLQAERAMIKLELGTLKKQLQNDGNWKNTSALIDEMLRLNIDTRKAATSAEDRP